MMGGIRTETATSAEIFSVTVNRTWHWYLPASFSWMSLIWNQHSESIFLTNSFKTIVCTCRVYVELAWSYRKLNLLSLTIRLEPVESGIVLEGSTLSILIHKTGKSLTYCTEHSNSMDPPMSITFSWEMYEMVGNRCPVTKEEMKCYRWQGVQMLADKMPWKFVLIILPMIKKLATNTAAILVKLIIKNKC